jgi:SPP1 gp7 family putative phage head morphogenesis protein
MYTLVGFQDSEKKKPIPKKKKKVVARKRLAKKEPEPTKPVAKKKPAVTTKTQQSAFERNKGIENHYQQQLYGVANRIGAMVKKINPESNTSIDNVVGNLNVYSDQLREWAEKLSDLIVYSLNDDDEKTWNGHAVSMSRALRVDATSAPIDKLLKQYMDDQVDLITSLPRSAAQRIHNLVYKGLYEGGPRAKGLATKIMETEGVTKSRAQLIARTEISRISTGLTKVRSEEIGLEWYIWHSTHDVRARDSHKFMDGVVVRWDDPPSPEKLSGKGKPYGSYQAGESYNCRCYPAPVIRIDDITFPARVHRNGRIVTMSRAQFAEISNGELAYAA